ncbi:hypothetical protein HK405_000488, partial [Cladochytrium tenue]
MVGMDSESRKVDDFSQDTDLFWFSCQLALSLHAVLACAKLVGLYRTDDRAIDANHIFVGWHGTPKEPPFMNAQLIAERRRVTCPQSVALACESCPPWLVTGACPTSFLVAVDSRLKNVPAPSTVLVLIGTATLATASSLARAPMFLAVLLLDRGFLAVFGVRRRDGQEPAAELFW